MGRPVTAPELRSLNRSVHLLSGKAPPGSATGRAAVMEMMVVVAPGRPRVSRPCTDPGVPRVHTSYLRTPPDWKRLFRESRSPPGHDGPATVERFPLSPECRVE